VSKTPEQLAELGDGDEQDLRREQVAAEHEQQQGAAEGQFVAAERERGHGGQRERHQDAGHGDQQAVDQGALLAAVVPGLAEVVEGEGLRPAAQAVRGDVVEGAQAGHQDQGDGQQPQEGQRPCAQVESGGRGPLAAQRRGRGGHQSASRNARTR
jgi:hypothetical protein